MAKQILYFNFEDKIFEFHLPAINNRIFKLKLTDKYTDYPCELTFENWDGIWYAKSDDNLLLVSENYSYETLRLENLMTIQVTVKNEEEVFTIMVFEQNHDITNFSKIYINQLSEIWIGRDDDCDIQIKDEFVENHIGHKHALIYKSNGEYYVKDNESKNGTFLNGHRLFGSDKLNYFDEIYVLGFKFIFLGGVLAYNNQERICTNCPEISLEQLMGAEETELTFETEEPFFSRSPRTMEPLDTEKVEIEAPPTSHVSKQEPLLFLIGPSVTMPIPIMLSVLYNSSTGSGTSMLLGSIISVGASALIGAFWSLAHQRYNKKLSVENEKNRVEGYQAYIENNRQMLEEKHTLDKEVLEKQYLSTEALIDMPIKQKDLLWNRNVNHKDFLTIRLGKGKVPFPSEISVPKERFSLEKDELVSLPHDLKQQFKNMSGAVVTYDLRKSTLIGVIGNHEKVMSVARTMVVQLAALNRYTDVKIAFLADDKDFENTSWVRWLPHTFSSDKKIRYVASDENSYQNVLFELTSELRSRDEENDNKNSGFLPHYVVFCTQAELMENEAIFSYMISQKDYGFTFILLYDEINRLPNECLQIIEASENFCGKFALDAVKDETSEIEFDTVTVKEAEKFAKCISGITVKESAGGEIPTSVEFLEMLQIGKVEQWDLIRHYKENRVYENIRSFIGLTYGNQPMYLDIHEKKSGPHGLIAGTTGSGKSETIMTFILSLAMNYHPDEVAFVLIDYKGGGMAAPFIGMPHTAGTITNIGNGDETESIDENQTRRALISIKSEIKRRQKIFSRYKVNHIDAYIRLYRDGQAEAPLPHLIIISDEFAELKKEQPEFIKELVSTARVGRSLGIHLILATQKPAGNVDDEIWSNSRFKLCLRVQDKQDSNEMLKRPEAAFITGTGRAYLQIGNDEIFEMFQSGYAGASYEPKDEIELSQHNEVSMIGLDGARCVIPVRKQSSGNISQLDACVNYIKKVAKENGISPVKPLWMPPLPRELFLDELLQEYDVDRSKGISAVVGLIDQPEQQKQYPAVLHLMDEANLIVVGNIGMGKTTFIQTMLYDIVTHYSAKEFHFYCMDFSSRTFRMFETLPHCGGVAFSEEEEAVGRMIDLIQSIMLTRRKLFEDAKVGSFSEYIHIDTLPLVALCIDNYVMFKELYENLEDQFAEVVREGFKYGIYVIVTANSVNDLNYRLRQNFALAVPLYLGDKGRYMDTLNINPEFLPGNEKGRGLWYDGNIMEFQTALPFAAKNELERNQKMSEQFELERHNSDPAIQALRVPSIPKGELYETFLENNLSEQEMPFGYNVENLQVTGMSLAKTYCFSVSATNEMSYDMFYKNLCTYAMRYQIEMWYVGQNKVGAKENGVHIDEYEEMFDFSLMLKEEFTNRSHFRKEKLLSDEDIDMEDTLVENFGRKWIFIEDLSEFIDAIYSNWGKDKELFYPLFEAFFKQGSEMGILFVANVSSSQYYNIQGQEAGKIFLSYQTGIHFGGHLDQQRLFEFQLRISEQMKARDYNVGCWIHNDMFEEVFMPVDQPGKGEADGL